MPHAVVSLSSQRLTSLPGSPRLGRRLPKPSPLWATYSLRSSRTYHVSSHRRDPWSSQRAPLCSYQVHHGEIPTDMNSTTFDPAHPGPQTMAHAAARVIIAPRLRLSSYLCLRLAVPFIAYLPLSMSYTLVSVAFGLPFNGRFVPPQAYRFPPMCSISPLDSRLPGASSSPLCLTTSACSP